MRGGLSSGQAALHLWKSVYWPPAISTHPWPGKQAQPSSSVTPEQLPEHHSPGTAFVHGVAASQSLVKLHFPGAQVAVKLQVPEQASAPTPSQGAPPQSALVVQLSNGQSVISGGSEFGSKIHS